MIDLFDVIERAWVFCTVGIIRRFSLGLDGTDGGGGGGTREERGIG